MTGQQREMSVDCHEFRRKLYHFQAGELPGNERRPLEEHVGRCESCARRLEFEDGFLRGLKGRLGRAQAPPELRVRVREALEREAAPRGLSGWARTAWLAPAAAALLLAFVLIPAVPRGAIILTVEREVTVVDIDCERAGRSLQEQRGCTHPHHVNALKVAPGRYWAISLDHELGRQLVSDPGMRGRQLRVSGDLYTSSGTLHLAGYSEWDAALRPSTRPPAEPPAVLARALSGS